MIETLESWSTSLCHVRPSFWVGYADKPVEIAAFWLISTEVFGDHQEMTCPNYRHGNSINLSISREKSKRAVNVVAGNEKVGPTYCKPTIYLKIIKVWLHLKEIPEQNGSSDQCLIKSGEFEDTKKHSQNKTSTRNWVLSSDSIEQEIKVFFTRGKKK